jgi:hypothetical protein
MVRIRFVRWGHAGAILDHAHLDEPERAVEVRPAVVVAHDARAAEGRQRRFPAPIGLGDFLQERLAVGLEHAGLLGRRAGQTGRDVRGDDDHIVWVERVGGLLNGWTSPIDRSPRPLMTLRTSRP